MSRTTRPASRLWTPAEDDIVRTNPVSEAVRRTGRTRRAVYFRRIKLKAMPGRSWQSWTKAEDKIVTSLPPRQAATQLPGRSVEAIYQRRWVIGNGKDRQYKPKGQRRI